MFFSPTMGIYQRRKMRTKRITQVKTNSPMKILFFGLASNLILLESGFEIKVQVSRLRPTRRYFNKFWDLPPLKFAEARNAPVMGSRVGFPTAVLRQGYFQSLIKRIVKILLAATPS